MYEDANTHALRKHLDREEQQDAIIEIREQAQFETPLTLCLENISEHDNDPWADAMSEVCHSDALMGFMHTDHVAFADGVFDILARHCKAADIVSEAKL